VPPAEVVHGFLAVRDISWFAEEWRPATWDSPQLLPFLALVGWTGLGWAFARRQGGHRPTLVDVSFLGVAILLAAPAYRGIALGAVVLAPVAAAAWGPATGVARPERPDPPDRVERVALALPLAAAAVWTLLAAPGMAASPARVPSALSEPLRALPAGTVVFDDVALGGWLLWDQPTLVPVLDTRLEAYGSAHLHAYVDALAATPGWERTLAGWRVGAALLAVDAPLATALEQAGWHESARALGGRTTYVLLLPTRYAVPPS